MRQRRLLPAVAILVVRRELWISDVHILTRPPSVTTAGGAQVRAQEQQGVQLRSSVRVVRLQVSRLPSIALSMFNACAINPY